jgi:hypothetical protein
MAFGIWFVNKRNALIYMVCTLGIHGKKYGIKNLDASATNVVVTSMQIFHATYAILT